MRAILIVLPVLGAALAHFPVLRFDLFPGLRVPIDGGATFRGRRLLGDNKTWRGALAMFTGVVLLALLLARQGWYWERLPAEIRRAGAGTFAVLLGLGTVLAELPNSFLKRQLDVAPGSQVRSPLGFALTIVDQGDFVPGIWLVLSPVWVMPPAEAALAFAVVVAVHLLVSTAGWALGARRTVL